LGIPVRTRHNEVAPSQYELAPQYEELNVAVDHNQLLMDLMDRVARRHKLAVLLHEKPFAGVNGSGKHNNWSLATNTGVNLLSPGSDPSNNLLFLTFFVNTIQAVHNYGDLLRASITSANNDHRLGANEAPPAIMSVFIGDAMTRTIEAFASDSNAGNTAKEAYHLTNMVPDLEKDNTDRNRTSPFAFTGNKFEIRMVGSSSNCAGPMTVMNMIMGKQLNDFYKEVNALIDSGKDKKAAVETILKRYITENRKVRFEGDNYSNAWKIEAKSRGLNNFQTTPEALAAFVEEKSELLFTESGVLSAEELHAHYDVKLESYSLQIQIESRILAEICLNQIIPASVRYQTELANNILTLQDLGLDEESYAAQLEMVKQLATHINALKSLINKMRDERAAANELGSKEKAFAYNDKVKPVMEQIREHAEELEDLVDDSEWPVAKYRELLFLK
jgi:glutamine synthetase